MKTPKAKTTSASNLLPPFDERLPATNFCRSFSFCDYQSHVCYPVRIVEINQTSQTLNDTVASQEAGD
jgi:hypothetical protein